ncbi:MAG: OsmC family protein [Armatimonadetes bacterium]|nr:OsmC family protein [Armatimonadota bacterium]
MINRNGSAVWKGSIKEGNGVVSTETGTLSNAQYSFSSRFESGTGTNPEELLGAAHAACFSMALSGVLTRGGLIPDTISTTAMVTVENIDGGFKITKVRLSTEGVIPNATDAQFQEAAATAKANCPVSKLFTGAEITLDAKLVSAVGA